MAQTGEEVKAPPPWDAIEAKYWESTRITRQEEDSERSALFAETIEESALAQVRLSQERERILVEARELETRLAQLQEMAEGKQRRIEQLAKEQALIKRTHEQERALVAQERALEDEQRREMFAKYRADDVQPFKPAEPETKAEVSSQVDPDVQGQPPSQTEAVQPQAQPNDQPALQPNGQHQHNHDSANGREKPLQPELPMLNAPPDIGLNVDLPLASIDGESILPGEGVGETCDSMVTPLSRHPSSEATSRLSTPPSEPQVDIDLVSLSRGLPPIGQLDAGEKPADLLSTSAAPERSPRPSGGFTAVNAGSVRPSPSVAGHGDEDGDVSGMATNDALAPKRKRRPTQKAQAQKRMSEVKTQDGSAPPDDEEQPPLQEITKEVLVLRDDGVVFTDPPAMRGVPLAKISKGDAYWVDEWPDLEATVAESLTRWEAKHVEHVAANHSNSTKFLANRQINRGRAILKFLKEGELHPFQIMGKEHIKKGLANYDRLFRMTQILEELTKFDIDVTPSQWLRQRLCEVLEEQGDKFDLAHTVNDLYHDPKVQAIRFKSGFRPIGRPPGYEPPAVDGSNGEASSAKKPASKRKRPQATPKTSPGGTQAAAPGLGEETPAAASPSQGPRKLDRSPEPFRGADQHQKPEPLDAIKSEEAPATSPAQTPPAKKARFDSNVAADDADSDGYTTTDSLSGGPIMEEDWRLSQVKHEGQGTDANVTQYWHWVADAQLFEHQVLTNGSGNKMWGVYAEPWEFHLRLGEVREVTVAVGSRKIVVRTRAYAGAQPRGDILVEFKRDRTKRRFLRFIKTKGIRVVKTTEAFVEDAWYRMEPLRSLGEDSSD